MYHKARLYDLSFAPPAKEPKTNPYLVFTFEKRLLPECVRRLQILDRGVRAEAYCEHAVDFSLPTLDLFGNAEFGYGRCGYMVEQGEEVSLYIELSNAHISHAALTVNLLAQIFVGDFGIDATGSNRIQQVDLETCCIHAAHGHSVGGNISGQVRDWLKKEWHKGAPDKLYGWVHMHDQVVAAMRHTWSAVASKDQKRWASDCNGCITEDGRFILNCFGNACDLAIYPDLCIDEYTSVRFSCHNLDSAKQQLTLLAGLAKLCELARAET